MTTTTRTVSRPRQVKRANTFEGSTIYPTRKTSLIEDARRDSSRASLDLNIPISCSPTNDDVFDIEGDGLSPIIDHLIKKVCITFSSKDGVGFGSLSQALKILEVGKMGLTHIESRPSDSRVGEYDFLVQCETKNGSCRKVLSALERIAESVKLQKEELSKCDVWFPKQIQDLDKCTHLMSNYEPDLDDEHPGSKDEEYVKRRKRISELAFTYKYGAELPTVEYTDEESRTWTHVFRNLKRLFPTHACQQFIDAFDLLEKTGIYREDQIPQLEEVSQFLKAQTGFQLRPVAGLLSARDFLASLAFRVFQATQYVRHRSTPMHTPEPDTLHELLGHVPMLADPSFAQFSQEIGLASLGVSDENITKLSTLYWFTVEFGLCLQDGEVRACGAGLLSAYGELQYALSDQCEHRPFDPSKVAVQEYQDKNYQPIYFVADSFEDAKQKLRHYAMTMPRPCNVRYDPYTQTVQVLDKVETVRDVVRDLKGQVDVLTSALEKITTRS